MRHIGGDVIPRGKETYNRRMRDILQTEIFLEKEKNLENVAGLHVGGHVIPRGKELATFQGPFLHYSNPRVLLHSHELR